MKHGNKQKRGRKKKKKKKKNDEDSDEEDKIDEPDTTKTAILPPLPPGDIPTDELLRLLKEYKEKEIIALVCSYFIYTVCDYNVINSSSAITN